MGNEEGSALKAQVEEIRAALLGDMTGKPGMMQNLVLIMNDIYNTQTGLKPRVDSIEDAQRDQKGLPERVKVLEDDKQKYKGFLLASIIFWPVIWWLISNYLLPNLVN